MWSLKFPSLGRGGFQETSSPTAQYNCVAWAADDDTKWWEPDPIGLFYWPTGVPRNYDISSLQKIFEARGYVICNNKNFELGFEKVAIFCDKNGQWTHLSKQLPNGNWTSKLGEGFDISHKLNDLEGDVYGCVSIILRREKN
jgi:hypothetical protein